MLSAAFIWIELRRERCNLFQQGYSGGSNKTLWWAGRPAHLDDEQLTRVFVDGPKFQHVLPPVAPNNKNQKECVFILSKNIFIFFSLLGGQHN